MSAGSLIVISRSEIYIYIYGDFYAVQDDELSRNTPEGLRELCAEALNSLKNIESWSDQVMNVG